MTISLNDMQNLVILTGHLAADAETKDIKGTALTTFQIATNERYKNRSGDWESKATFHNIEIWGRLAEKASEFKKGSQIQVWGKLVSNQKSQGSNGKNYYKSFVKAENLIPVTR